MFRKLMIGGITLLSMVGIGVVASSIMTSVYAESTVVVSGDTSLGENLPGWLFNRDGTTSTPFEFNTDAASVGSGSLYVMPIGSNASDKFIAENFINTPIADVDLISYDFKIGSGGTESDKVHFYMNVYANFGVSDDLKFYDCRYNIVPTVGSTADFTTVTFDPSLSYPVTTSGTSPHVCPPTPADMDLSSLGSNIRVFAINVGDTSLNDFGLDGYLDNVKISGFSEITTFDFDPVVMPEFPSSKDMCKSDGWRSFSSITFRNQGDCVSWVQSSEKSVGNRKDN